MCEPDVVYFGREVPPGKTVHLTPTDAADDDDDDGVSLVHVTQVALGPTPAPGRHTVFAVHDGAKVPVGTLQVGVCEQFAVDLMWSALAGAPHAGAVAFAHTGASSVYVSGYKTVTSLLDDASDGGEPASDEFDSEESEGESEEESEEEEAGGGRRAVKANGRVRDFSDMSSEGDDDEDDTEDDDDDDPFAGAADDDDSEDWSDEEEEAAAAALGGSARAGPRTPAKPSGGRAASDDSEEEDEEEDDGLTSGSDEGSEEESGSDDDDQPPPRAAPGKRSAPSSAPAPPSKTAKTQGHPSSDVAAFEAALAAHLRSAGPTKLATLGATVKKPASLPKLSKWLANNPKLFVVDEEQRVSLR